MLHRAIKQSLQYNNKQVKEKDLEQKKKGFSV